MLCSPHCCADLPRRYGIDGVLPSTLLICVTMQGRVRTVAQFNPTDPISGRGLLGRAPTPAIQLNLHTAISLLDYKRTSKMSTIVRTGRPAHPPCFHAPCRPVATQHLLTWQSLPRYLRYRIPPPDTIVHPVLSNARCVCSFPHCSIIHSLVHTSRHREGMATQGIFGSSMGYRREGNL